MRDSSPALGAVVLAIAIAFLWYFFQAAGATSLDGLRQRPDLALFLVFAVWVLLGMVRSFVNGTRLVLADGRLRISRGPLPERGAVDLDAKTIRQLCVRKHTVRGRNGTYTDHVLCVIAGDRTYRVYSTEARERVVYLERLIENRLGIPDQLTAVVPRPPGVTLSGSVGPIDARGMPEPGARGPLTLRWGWRGAGRLGNDIALVLFVDFAVVAMVSQSAAPVWIGVLSALGVLTLGWLLGRLLNHTELRLTADRIEVRHGPIPWPGTTTIAASSLRQLLVRPGMTPPLRLWAVVDGSQRAIGPQGTIDRLLHAEQVVERYYGITDDPRADDT
jgi:hypothetical protein